MKSKLVRWARRATAALAGACGAGAAVYQTGCDAGGIVAASLQLAANIVDWAT